MVTGDETSNTVAPVTVMGTILWSNDTGWDTPKVKYPGGEKYKLIDKYLWVPGLLCSSSGAQYMYLDVRNCWVNFASSSAISRVCDIVGMKNVSVSYNDAFKPFADSITKRCDSNVSDQVPTSVCIGTTRLEIGTDEDGAVLVFTPGRVLTHRTVSSIPRDVYSLCVMPVDLPIYPVRYQFPGKASLLEYVAQVFPDTRDLVTVMWIVGNSVLDPQENPKSLLLSGPGGSGKSTVLRAIYKSMARCCGTLPDGCLTGYTKSMAGVIAEAVASSRMVVCYDVDIEREPLNMAMFKNISGSDYIRVGFNTCKSTCSLALAANGYVDPLGGSVYTSDAIMRRAVCVMMDVNTVEIPRAHAPESVDDLLDFICSCLHIKLKYSHMPVSPLNVALTMCGSRYLEIRDMLRETPGPVPVHKAEEVIQLISIVSGIPLHNVGRKAKLISPLCVTTIDSSIYIKGLVLCV